MPRLPTPEESKPPAGRIGGASEPREGTVPIPEGEVAIRVGLDDVMPSRRNRT